MNYGQLKDRLKRELIRPDCTPSQIADWIDESISRAQRLLETAGSEEVYEITVTNGFTSFLLPNDLLRVLSLTVDGVQVRRGSIGQVNRLAESTGCPALYARDDVSIVLGPRPAAGQKIRLIYASEFEALENDTDENFLSIIASDIIIAGAMVQACMYFVDPRGPQYEERFITGIADLNRQSKVDDMTNAAVSPAPGFNF